MSERLRSANTGTVQVDGDDDKCSFMARFKADERIPAIIRKVNWPLVLGVVVWYTLNTTYVLQNKVFLNVVPLHWTASGAQMIIGAVACGLIWASGFRKVPRFTNTRKALMVFVPLGLCHLTVHYGAVISMGLGDVSFTQVVKAGEPVITAILSIIFLREILNICTYLSLIPVVAGVAMATVNGTNIEWGPFLFAMLSNLGSSSRAILAKITMKNKDDIGENLTAPNIYMILTVVSGILSIPVVLIAEASEWKEIWTTSTEGMSAFKKFDLLMRGLVAALSYYAYNDCAFYCLGQMNQVTHSIANTLKRVIVIITSIIMFNTAVNWLKGSGMVIAVAGAFVYSLAKQGFFSCKRSTDVATNEESSHQKGAAAV